MLQAHDGECSTTYFDNIKIMRALNPVTYASMPVVANDDIMEDWTETSAATVLHRLGLENWPNRKQLDM